MYMRYIYKCMYIDIYICICIVCKVLNRIATHK